MAIGWLDDVAEATTYFSTRFGASDWAAIAAGDKTSLLTTAYNRIKYSKKWEIPDSPSGDVLARLKYAQEELAWYMYIHIADEDRRKGIQAQGVIAAGVVQETYYAEMLQTIPFPPVVIDILDGLKTAKPIFFAEIDRREPVGLDQDVTDIDNTMNQPGVY